MPNELMIVHFLEGLADQAYDQAGYFYQKYETAYYEASQGELNRLADEGDRLSSLSQELKYWARVWQYGWPGEYFAPEFHYPE